MKPADPKVWPLGHPPLGTDPTALRESLLRHLTYSLAKTPEAATPRDWFNALVLTVRDRLVERLIKTAQGYQARDAKRVYYLSMEYLIGRSLVNNLLALGVMDEIREVVEGLGLTLDQLARLEDEAALGNGGLGRLAACLMDSLATLDLPGYGYGVRYELGMFTQRIENGWQVEHPDNWLRYGNPWELPRPEVLYPVQLYGRVEWVRDPQGRYYAHWVDTEQVMAMAYDMPVAGLGTATVNNLRLWAAKATREFTLADFNQGNYVRAVEHKTLSENLSRVLYPDDSSYMGRELRLKQEYFFVSASIHDILRRYLQRHDDPEGIPDRIVIQLNDTHPALAVVELLRLLLDAHRLPWERAWDITRRTFAYTNHTLLPEALEAWPVGMLERVLPRHLQLIYEINRRHIDAVSRRFPGDIERLRRMSLIEEDGERRARMGHLAVVGSFRVNGVSALHARLLVEQVFGDFEILRPGTMIGITNGITPRRWLNQANPGLAALLDREIGSGWRRDLSQLAALEARVDDPRLADAFAAVKRRNKEWLGRIIKWRTGIEIAPDALCDVQVKRIHEYKRQLLCLLYVIARYNSLKAHPNSDAPPRVVIFAGKAAPGYRFAKLVIKLISDVARVINGDAAVADRLKVVFLPNYDVSTAADIIPAADLSEQISTAGYEASGTGNMKLALNGALTIGTLDGANIEIRDAVGAECFFHFGLTAGEVARLQGTYHPKTTLDNREDLRLILDQLMGGFFSPGERGLYEPIVDRLLHGDRFMVIADYADYLRAQEEVDLLYQDRTAWTRRALLGTARMGWFSSDRMVREYNEKVWGVSSAY